MTRIYIFLQLTLFISALALFSGQAKAQNRTFSLIAINPQSPAVDGKDVAHLSAQNPSGIGVGFATSLPLSVFIYNQTLYMKCSSSPTGACIGYYQKNFGGALKGWNFQFWFNEDFPTTNPIGSFAGRFSVQNIDGVNLLVSGIDQGTGQNGSPLYSLCEYPGTASGSGYAYLLAVTDVVCIYQTKFKVIYSDANTCPQ